MKTINIFTFITALLCISIYGKSQTSFLKKNDKIPDVAFSKLINHSKAQAKLSNFKDKFILLYFWDKGCSSCIPTLNQLKKIQDDYLKFNFQVIVITNQSEIEINKQTKLPKNIILVLDTVLTNYFSRNINEPYAALLSPGQIVYSLHPSLHDGKNALPHGGLIDEVNWMIALSKTNKVLKIGDTVPDIILDKIYNYPDKVTKLSKFKGKLVILDFWNWGCKGCIASFPKMEALQREFGDKIQIFLVNGYEAQQTLIERGFPKETKLKNINNATLPFVINLELTQLFWHWGEPFHVWIDQKGIVRAMNNNQITTENTIKKFLNGEGITFQAQKTQDEIIHLAENGNQLTDGRNFSNFRYYSILGGPTDENLMTDISIKGKYTGEYQNNYPLSSIVGLFRDSFRDFPYDRVLVELPNPRKYYYPPSDSPEISDWMLKNSYVHRIVWASSDSTTKKDIHAKLDRIKRADLENYFGIQGCLEKRKVVCLILRANEDAEQRLRSKDIGRNNITYEKTGTGIMLKAVPYNNLPEWIRSYNFDNKPDQPRPFIDETGFIFKPIKVDIEINSRPTDIMSMNKELQKYGLKLIEEEREIEMLVLKKTSHNKANGK